MLSFLLALHSFMESCMKPDQFEVHALKNQPQWLKCWNLFQMDKLKPSVLFFPYSKTLSLSWVINDIHTSFRNKISRLFSICNFSKSHLWWSWAATYSDDTHPMKCAFTSKSNLIVIDSIRNPMHETFILTSVLNWLWLFTFNSRLLVFCNFVVWYRKPKSLYVIHQPLCCIASFNLYTKSKGQQPSLRCK